MWENFEKKLMDISVAVHKKGTKSRANIKIRARFSNFVKDFLAGAYH